MPRMPVMDAVVKILESEGVRVVFGVPGAAILPMYKSLSKSQTIKHYTVRHEEGGTHAADGYARATGKVGINIGTSGPAGTNMITGLYTCLADSIPIICFTGQAPLPMMHKEAFQAVDIAEIAKPVTKWSIQAKEAAQLPWIIRQAFKIAQEGRPGPVLIDLPIDVQRGEVDYDPDLEAPLAINWPEPNQARIRRALEMVQAAERPLILCGGGVTLGNAYDGLRQLAEYLQVPVSVTLQGKGAFPEDHPLFAGMAGIQTQTRWGNAIFLESDLVLAIGARFAERHTGDLKVYRGDRKFIHIDIDAFQMGRVFEPDLGIVADAQLACRALLDEAKQVTPQRQPGAWVQRVDELRRTLLRKTDFDDVPVKPQRVFQEVNEFFDPDTIFVTAIGLYQIFSGQHQITYKPRHYLCCGQAGPLGWEVPACIGVKLGQPDKLVAAIVGDYSFQFLMEEVAVAAQYRIPYVLVLLNNGYLGLIRQSEMPYQMNFGVDIAYEAMGGFEDLGVDHVKFMESMGALGRRVTQPGDIKDALAWAVEASNRERVPALVEIICEREANAPMGPALDRIIEYGPLADATPRAERERAQEELDTAFVPD